MSQISILGFTPSSSSDALSFSSTIHWTILISPFPPSTCKSQKAKSRFFQPRLSTKEHQSDSILFDMHNHQLRQQPFPIPVTDASTESDSPSGAETAETESSETASSAPSPDETSPTISPTASTSPSEPAASPLTITTLNATTSHPLQLTIKILASTLTPPPQKLIPKLAQRLYNTPTYGPADDWLRDALSTMHDGLLEPGFDVDQFVEYACDAAKEYALYEPSAPPPPMDIPTSTDPARDPAPDASTKDREVLELDYSAHVAHTNAQVKALLAQQMLPTTATVSSPTTPQSRSPAVSVKAAKRSRGLSIAGYKILGFRIAPSPTSYAPASRQGSVHGRDRYSFERPDDPYSGLM